MKSRMDIGWQLTDCSNLLTVERTAKRMTNTAVLITDMGILVGIFLLGMLAKIFPRSRRKAGSKQ